MAINFASASTLLSSSILLLLIASCSAKYGIPASPGNVLKSGEELGPDKSLTVGHYKFIMQNDCNLVLYEKEDAIWASRTKGMGSNCSLLLKRYGELHIISDLWVTVWTTEVGGEYGKYTLVLQPNGNVVIYGSPIWSTGTFTPQKQTVNAPPRKSIPQTHFGSKNP